MDSAASAYMKRTTMPDTIRYFNSSLVGPAAHADARRIFAPADFRFRACLQKMDPRGTMPRSRKPWDFYKAAAGDAAVLSKLSDSGLKKGYCSMGLAQRYEGSRQPGPAIPQAPARPLVRPVDSNSAPAAGVLANVARFRLRGPAARLQITRTLEIAETCRAAAMGIYGSLFPAAFGGRSASPVFSGKRSTGQPLIGHRHAYFLPTDEDHDGRLDHLTVIARSGFTAPEQAALAGLSRLWSASDSVIDMECVGLGLAEEFVSGPLAVAGIWESATPYLATRFGRADRSSSTSAAEFLAADMLRQLLECCGFCGSGAAPVIEPIGRATACGPVRPAIKDFVRSRQRKDDNGVSRACGYFRVRFSQAVKGPLSLGHNAHFGMGLFLPAKTGRAGGPTE